MAKKLSKTDRISVLNSVRSIAMYGKLSSEFLAPAIAQLGKLSPDEVDSLALSQYINHCIHNDNLSLLEQFKAQLQDRTR